MLWQECLEAGQSIEPNNDALIEVTIEILDPLATAYEFRYMKVGLKHMPQLDELELARSGTLYQISRRPQQVTLPRLRPSLRHSQEGKH